MSFIVRILFTGLMTFVPSQDGTELTVLLLNAGHSHTSDGSMLSQHKPLLFARAGNCSGDCPTRDADIAQFVYSDQSSSVALDSLESAVSGGGAWELTGSDLSLSKGSTSDPDLPSLSFTTNTRGTVNGQPQVIPTTSAEREDYSWVADMKQLVPGFAINSSVFDTEPPAIVAARLKLRSGNVFTYSVARIGSNVTPVQFARLDGTGSASSYSQAVASWVAADIEVSGDSIEIVDSKFNGDPGRSMTLTPDSNGKVEIALVNLPPFVPPASSANDAPQVGKHFELYYDLASTPETAETRLVPRAVASCDTPSYPEVDWQDVHPSTAVGSDLLSGLRLDIGRGAYDRILCPPSNNNLP